MDEAAPKRKTASATSHVATRQMRSQPLFCVGSEALAAEDCLNQLARAATAKTTRPATTATDAASSPRVLRLTAHVPTAPPARGPAGSAPSRVFFPPTRGGTSAAKPPLSIAQLTARCQQQVLRTGTINTAPLTFAESASGNGDAPSDEERRESAAQCPGSARSRGTTSHPTAPRGPTWSESESVSGNGARLTLRTRDAVGHISRWPAPPCATEGASAEVDAVLSARCLESLPLDEQEEACAAALRVLCRHLPGLRSVWEPRAELVATLGSSFARSVDHEVDVFCRTDMADNVENNLRQPYERVATMWAELAAAAAVRAKEVAEWQREEEAVYLCDIAAADAEFTERLDALAVPDPHIETALRRRRLLHERQAGVNEKLKALLQQEAIYNEAVRANKQLVAELASIRKSIEDCKRMRAAMVEHDTAMFRREMDEQMARVQDLKGRLSEIEWLQDRKESLEACAEEEAERALHLKDEVTLWKAKAEAPVVERSPTLTPRPSWRAPMVEAGLAHLLLPQSSATAAATPTAATAGTEVDPATGTATAAPQPASPKRPASANAITSSDGCGRADSPNSLGGSPIVPFTPTEVRCSSAEAGALLGTALTQQENLLRLVSTGLLRARKANALFTECASVVCSFPSAAALIHKSDVLFFPDDEHLGGGGAGVNKLATARQLPVAVDWDCERVADNAMRCMRWLAARAPRHASSSEERFTGWLEPHRTQLLMHEYALELAAAARVGAEDAGTAVSGGGAIARRTTVELSAAEASHVYSDDDDATGSTPGAGDDLGASQTHSRASRSIRRHSRLSLAEASAANTAKALHARLWMSNMRFQCSAAMSQFPAGFDGTVWVPPEHHAVTASTVAGLAAPILGGKVSIRLIEVHDVLLSRVAALIDASDTRAVGYVSGACAEACVRQACSEMRMGHVATLQATRAVRRGLSVRTSVAVAATPVAHSIQPPVRNISGLFGGRPRSNSGIYTRGSVSHTAAGAAAPVSAAAAPPSSPGVAALALDGSVGGDHAAWQRNEDLKPLSRLLLVQVVREQRALSALVEACVSAVAFVGDLPNAGGSAPVVAMERLVEALREIRFYPDAPGVHSHPRRGVEDGFNAGIADADPTNGGGYFQGPRSAAGAGQRHNNARSSWEAGLPGGGSGRGGPTFARSDSIVLEPSGTAAGGDTAAPPHSRSPVRRMSSLHARGASFSHLSSSQSSPVHGSSSRQRQTLPRQPAVGVGLPLKAELLCEHIAAQVPISSASAHFAAAAAVPEVQCEAVSPTSGGEASGAFHIATAAGVGISIAPVEGETLSPGARRARGRAALVPPPPTLTGLLDSHNSNNGAGGGGGDTSGDMSGRRPTVFGRPVAINRRRSTVLVSTPTPRSGGGNPATAADDDDGAASVGGARRLVVRRQMSTASATHSLGTTAADETLTEPSMPASPTTNGRAAGMARVQARLATAEDAHCSEFAEAAAVIACVKAFPLRFYLAADSN